MGDNGLIDLKFVFSTAWCFSRPVKCLAASPVAYKIQHCCSYSIPRYYRIYWQQSSPGKAAAGGCLPAPTSGKFRSQPAACPSQGCRSHPNLWWWWHLPKRAGNLEARVKALTWRPKQSKTLKLTVQIHPELESTAQMQVKDQSTLGSSKHQLKPKVFEAGSACGSKI